MSRRYYFSIFLYFLVLLLVTTLSLAFVFEHFSSNILSNEIYSANLKALNTIVENMNYMLEGMDNLSLQLSMDPNINYFTTKKFSDDYYRLKIMTDTLDSIKVSNQYLESIYVYYSEDGQMVTSPHGKVDPELFPDADWLMDLSYTNDIKWLFNRVISGRQQGNYNVISYIRFFPVGVREKIGAVTLNIDKEKIINVIKDVNNRTGGIVVFKPDGKPILSTLKSNFDLSLINLENIIEDDKLEGYKRVKIGDKKYFISFSTGEYNWKYVMLTPISALSTLNNVIRNIVIICTLLAVGVGILLTALFSQHLYVPIRNLLKTLNNDDKQVNVPANLARFEEFQKIQTSINKIVENNRLLMEKFKETMTYAYERVILGLLHGDISMAKLTRRDIRLPFADFKTFIILTLELDDYDKLIQDNSDEEIDHIQDSIIDLCYEVYSQLPEVYINVLKTSPYQCTCILALPEINNQDILAQDLYKKSNKIKDVFNHTHSFSLSIGISDIGKKPGDIYHLYLQSCKIIDYRLIQGKNTVIYAGNQEHIQSKEIFYPYQEEEEIIRSIKSGDIDKGRKAVEDFIDQVVQNRNIKSQCINYIFAQLLGSIIKLSNDMGFDLSNVLDNKNIFEVLAACKYKKQLEDFMKSLISRIINYLEDREENNQDKIVKTVLEFIEENYQDQQLSLDRIAEQVYLSSNYLQNIFKEKMNQTVIEFLYIYRMKKARFLLENSTLKVKEIANKVGYNSSRSFIRAFKKYEGITPGQYRKQKI